MDWNEIMTEVLKWVLSVALAAAGTAIAAFFAKLRAKAEEERKDETEAALLEKCEDAVTSAVAYVQQTIVSGIKGTDEWTEEAQSAAAETAYDKAVNIIGADNMEKLQAALGDAGSWIESKVEQAVLASKLFK